MLRSLRKADAEAIANDLEERVSRHLERIGGRAISFRALVPDARGRYQLPDWAQPFARFGLVMLGPGGGAKTPRRRVEELAVTIAPALLGRLARYAASMPPGAALEPAAVEPELWQILRDAGLISQDSAGSWWFLPEAQPRLAESVAGVSSGAPSDAFADEMRLFDLPDAAISNIPLTGEDMKRSIQDRVVRLDEVR